MKSNKNSRAVVVGIFILIGIIIFIVGVLALGGQRKTFARTITVRSVFDDVNGLQNGSNIWYAGVKVGTVRKIAFTPDARVEVNLDIEEKAVPYIHNDAVARIGTDGLIGNKIVILSGGSSLAPVIKKGDLINVARAPGMDEMMNTFQANNKNLLEITGDIKMLTRRLVNGEGSVGRLLNDPYFANSLQTTMDHLQRTAESAQNMTAKLSQYVAKLQAKGTITNELITDTVIFRRLKSASIKIDELTTSAGALMHSLSNAGASLNNGINNPNTPAGTLLHDSVSAQSLKATIVNMQAATIKLNDDLEALQHNFLFRGFFKKKTKEEKSAQKSASVQ